MALAAALGAGGGAAAQAMPLRDPGDLDQALERAREANGLAVLVLVRSEEAQDLAFLDALQDAQVAEVLRRFPAVAICHRRHPAVATRFGVERFPMILLLEPAGGEVGRISGPIAPRRLAEKAREMVDVALEARARARRREGEAAVRSLPPGAAPGGAESPEGSRPAAAEDQLAEARLAWQRGNRFRAVLIFEGIIKQADASGTEIEGRQARAISHFYLGEHHRKSGRADLAERHYREAIADLETGADAAGAARGGPDSRQAEARRYRARAALGLALALRSLGRKQEAVEALESSRKRGIEDSSAQRTAFMLGYFRWELGEKAAARRHFEEARDLGPETRLGRRAARYLEPAAAGRPEEPPALEPLDSE